jgi:hypothetical protein
LSDKAVNPLTYDSFGKILRSSAQFAPSNPIDVSSVNVLNRDIVSFNVFGKTDQQLDPYIKQIHGLIGKIADVGLFAERTEITINHKTTVELEQELAKLVSDYVDVETKLVSNDDVEEEEDDDGAPRQEEEGESAGPEEGDAEISGVTNEESVR